MVKDCDDKGSLVNRLRLALNNAYWDPQASLAFIEP
jgi:hypothetical protein